ncbi:MAG TPA: hypothetical protein VEY12_06985 [Thermoplasmata archaeon]|nr:hypothetical protein [Thermoplasmata archaeon]
MAAVPRTPAPVWARRIQGWSFLVFFVALILLTFAAVEFWNAGDFEMSGYFAGLASVAPLLLLALIYYGMPVWGISVPLGPDAVAGALATAAVGHGVEPVAERDGPFARCVAVVHFDEPACTLGWSPEPTAPGVGASRRATVVVLRPETRDRTALAAFRTALARSLVDAARSAA